uniref:Uncharacterized protein n=1 Tax=Strongyloides venezuelensis TaxID=75913 RepID=A0A0K0FHY6_STRVS
MQRKKIRHNLQQEHDMRMEIDTIENNVPDDWYGKEDIVLDDTNVFDQKLLKLMCLFAVKNIYTEKSLSAFNDFTIKLVNLVSEQFEDYEDTIDTRARLSTVAFNLDIAKKTYPEFYYETTEVPFFKKNTQNTFDSEEESEIGT